MTDNPNQKQNNPNNPNDPRNQSEEERRKQGQGQDVQKLPNRGEHEGSTDDQVEKKDQGQRRAS
ncbi:MAG TPA: hypothetical protein VF753_08745 [Terriglobales bacterium]